MKEVNLFKYREIIRMIGIVLFASFFGLTGCKDEVYEKGFPVTTTSESGDSHATDGISKDSLSFRTKPSNVLLTGMSKYRLTTIYKVNYNKNKIPFIGSNSFHFSSESIGETAGNQWHSNYLPGFEAVYGYNMVNVSHYNTETQVGKEFFEKPVLIKTVYYPSFSKDTLNYKPVNRDYYMISVYDEDTDKDGFINMRDLRRFYCFNADADNKRALVPINCSVYKSEYDSGNDLLYVFTQLDENENGRIDESEPTRIFWIDLKDPEKSGRLY